MTSLSCVTAIVGPTASGKSSLAEKLACALDTHVVSVDAMQIYRGMDIGTAKTPVSERKAPLDMVDVVDVSEDYSVQRFQLDARACVDALISQGKHPVLCGGTGLYLDAVIDEMAFPQGTKFSQARKRYEDMLAEQGAQALHEHLRARDPLAADLIHPNNTRRVIRALEMADEGVSYAKQNEGLHHRQPHYNATLWAITMDRGRLYERIDQRVDAMFSQGLVDEVKALRDAGLDDAPTASQAIGYKEVLDALDGRCTLDEACELIKVRTHRYAKRQLSWLRRDGRVRWIDYDSVSEYEALRTIMSTLAIDEEDG